MAQDFSRVMNMARTAWGRKHIASASAIATYTFDSHPNRCKLMPSDRPKCVAATWIQSNPIPIRLDPKTVARWTTCNKWPGRGALKTSPDDLGVPAGTTLMRNLQGEAGGEHISISLQSGLIYSTTWQCFISYVQAKFGKMLETFH